ncbi:MAG: hypothetical protein AB7S99_22150 [Pseudodonghicola sp.]
MQPTYSRGASLLMAAPLYAGPLLAGWMGAPWIVPGALAALFFLAQVMAGRAAGRGARPLPLYLLVLALTQIVLVLAVYAAGAGLAVLTGPLALPIWLPLVLTGFGAALLILRHPHELQQDETLDLLGQALETMENGNGFDAEPEAEEEDAEVLAAAQEAVSALWALPADAPELALDDIVRRLETRCGHRAFPALLAQIGEGYPTVDRAMLRYLRSPAVRHRLIADKADLPFAFELLLDSGEAGVQADLAALVETLLAESAPPAALPPVDLLRVRAESFPVLAPLVAPVERAQRQGPPACG